MFTPLRIKLDIISQGIVNTGYTLVSNDYNSCDLIVNVLEHGQLVDDLSGYSATIVVSRADEVIVNDFMVVTDDLSIKLPNSMYAIEGEVRCDISLYKDGAKKTLQPFTFKVRQNIDVDGAIQGDTRIGVLDTLIDETLSVSQIAEFEARRAKAVSDVLNEKIQSDYYRGAKGDKGDTGAQGIQGIQGDTGDTGAQGIQGIKGDKGDTGEQGIQGIKGDKGDTGEQGIQGIKGDKGDTGEQGIQGIKGDKGDTGEQGIQGIQGIKGDTGAQGTSGTPKGVYATLVALQTAYPTGPILDADKGIYLVTADGKWYYWNGSAWTEGGTYQATGIANGSITPIKTSFMTYSENIIDPVNRYDGHSLAFSYHSSNTESYAINATLTAYTESFTVVQGDIFYSNSQGRLVWYHSGNLVEGNTAFSFDTTLGLYKATVGAGGVKAKIDAYISDINVAGYWFACKSVNYSGTKSPYGTTKLKDSIDSNIFAKKTALDNAITDISALKTPTNNATFFIPHYLYCYESNKASKWIPKYNVLATKNYDDFYLDMTAPNGALRDFERVKTQASDTPTLKVSANNNTAYSKVYVRRSVNPTLKTNPSTQKNILVIGDSYSDAGYIPCDIKKQIVIDNGFTNFNFIGTKTDTVDGVTALNEGRGGYTIDDFTKTINTAGRGSTFPNPFLSGGEVNFATYMSNNSFSGSLDYVILELGVNNIVAMTNNPSTIKTKLQSLIDLILASYPSCKIFVCGLVMISKINGEYDCTYHNSLALNVNKEYENLCENAGYASNCVYVDTAIFFDTEYGFPYSMSSYRGSTEQHKVQTDWLHPSASGYYMMSDTISSAFIYHMS